MQVREGAEGGACPVLEAMCFSPETGEVEGKERGGSLGRGLQPPR